MGSWLSSTLFFNLLPLFSISSITLLYHTSISFSNPANIGCLRSFNFGLFKDLEMEHTFKCFAILYKCQLKSCQIEQYRNRTFGQQSLCWLWCQFKLPISVNIIHIPPLPVYSLACLNTSNDTIMSASTTSCQHVPGTHHLLCKKNMPSTSLIFPPDKSIYNYVIERT